MNKRECIFCDSQDLSKEHIYSKWLFDLIKPDKGVFTPSFHIIEKSTSNELIDRFLEDKSDGRVIRYNDFTLKQVCKNCNNGWMSELESSVKTIIFNLENDENNSVSNINIEDALTLSQWAILKIMLASLASQKKIYFNKMSYNLIKKAIIPEGFLVEGIRLNHSGLNFVIGGPIIRKSFEISREELDFAASKFYKASLQIGHIAFRISYLRTDIPVFRKQIIRKMFLLYPYKSKLPFDDQNECEIPNLEKFDLPLLNTQLVLHD